MFRTPLGSLQPLAEYRTVIVSVNIHSLCIRLAQIVFSYDRSSSSWAPGELKIESCLQGCARVVHVELLSQVGCP